MKCLKLIIIYVCRVFLRLFWFIPIKKTRIYFSADRGTGIRCNPFYIFRYMQKHYGAKYEYIWEYDGTSKIKDIICVRPRSLKNVYYQLTSKVLISNDGFGSFLPKRKNQLFINTWHGGGAYKKSGIDFITDQHSVDLKINQICGKQTDIFISGCEKFSDVMSVAKMVSRNRFWEIGMPRNDFLIKGTEENISGKVRKYFDIDEEKKIVLFAPTYRGEEKTARFHSEIDVEKCVGALKKRFGGEWVFLMRKHHFVKTIEYKGCINASEYPNMQELLYATDVFITDYSSTICDYSLTFKPGFLFTPDLKAYECERSFYTLPQTWAFPIALTNEELEKEILDYDIDKAKEKILKHQEALGNKETGNAAELICDKIINYTI